MVIHDSALPNRSSTVTGKGTVPSAQQIATVRTYIKQTWQTLTRSHQHLLSAAIDPKIDHLPGTPWLVYVSAREDRYQVAQTLQQAMSEDEFQQIELRILPGEPNQIEQHGLLYLPHPYVVPGGRFNEMYGWDSYFIQLGLLRDGEQTLAQCLVDQLIYEVDHYGMVLNANRTYCLTRSQPPVLTLMILAVFKQSQDMAWLQSTLPAIDRYYAYWTVPPHLNQNTGLSRYYALGDGPAPEVVMSERDEVGRTHYDRARDYYRTHAIEDYDLSLYYDAETDALTDLFYKGDRSMRESGFDPSNRFGVFNVDIIHYLPVCLNSLLYQMEQDTAQIYTILGYCDLAQQWSDRAHQRQEAINHLLWDETTGFYLDYHIPSGQRRFYEFATTFYPLWVGLASPAQAQRVVENLPRLEAPGGLLTSTSVTGNQWDAPFGWAPLQLIAVQGLRRYGYDHEATQLANKFIRLVVQEFETQGTLLEKYDVCACSSQVSDGIHFGYSSNEIGFGWTNGVLLELLSLGGLA